LARHFISVEDYKSGYCVYQDLANNFRIADDSLDAKLRLAALFQSAVSAKSMNRNFHKGERRSQR